MTVPAGWSQDLSGWAIIQDTVFTDSNRLEISATHQIEWDEPTITEAGANVFGNLDDPIFTTLFPEEREDCYIGQVTFKSEVPAGADQFIDLCIESGGTVIFEDQRLYLGPSATDQRMAFVVLIPTTDFIFDNGVDVFLIPSTTVEIWDIVAVWNKTFNTAVGSRA